LTGVVVICQKENRYMYKVKSTLDYKGFFKAAKSDIIEMGWNLRLEKRM
jgi:hypothetical protein